MDLLRTGYYPLPVAPAVILQTMMACKKISHHFLSVSFGVKELLMVFVFST